MRYRFSATTSDGQVRSGYLEAEDEAGATRQIVRRGLTLQSLAEDLAETPTYIKSDVGALTNKMPVPGPPPQPPLWRRLDPRKVNWRRVDWPRVGLAGIIVALLLSVIGYGLSRAMADRTYHLKLTGQYHLVTKRKFKTDLGKRVHPRLWLPKPRWFIDQTGAILAKGKDGKWKRLPQRAKVQYTASIEGNYTFDIEVALPSVPEGCGLVLVARGFTRVSKKGVFKPKKDYLECQVPTASLKPIASKVKVAGTTTTPKGKRKRRRPRTRRARPAPKT